MRLSNFFDDGTVVLLHERDQSGVLAASGTVNGVRTIAFCTDGTVMGGAMGVEGCAHIVNAYDTAIDEQSPIVGIWHSGGARLAEGVRALHAVGQVFEAMIRASGYVPQVSVVVGFAAGGAAYGPALTDVVVMAPESRVFVTGPTWCAVLPARTSTWPRWAARRLTTRSPGCATSSLTTSSTPTSGPPPGRLVLPAGAFRPQQGRGRRHRHPRAAARVGSAGLRRASDRDRDP
ncbi:carboxyl transferase domain protein [Mycobacterium ulcerans str. Harvey]|uniref:Carboxyl transferase domain protein n=1 Tax=Mycobacterium ulcerans str. Harvey TaxID=1299332 RepID=A0ABN0R2U0_MYCUL|nr:carboxyl transferase domain protein [Mycobacterium ulcerans str. Harvey]